MLSYSNIDAQNIISFIIGQNVYVEPIGHHNLKRHLVYRVENNNEILGVFKFYYKKNRWNREVAALKTFKHTDIKTPKIINYGKLSDGTEWVFMTYVGGQIFEHVKKNIDRQSLKRIYKEIGDELSKIHSLKPFDFFGALDENGEGINKYNKFSSLFKHGTESVMDEIINQHLPEEELQIKAGDRVRELMYLTEEVREANLCNGDFGDRNILVKKVYDRWSLSAFIDFEHSNAYDRDAELIDYYYNLLDKDKVMAEAFKKGYEKHMEFNKELDKKRELYDLFSGLDICSWAKIQAPDYYPEGVKLLKKYIK